MPPSLNRTGTRGSWKVTSRHKRQWQGDLWSLLMAEQLPKGLKRVVASATLRFPTARRRDAGNFSWLLEKALGDALTQGGWLSDDTHDRFRFTGVTIESERGPARTIVTVTEVPDMWVAVKAGATLSVHAESGVVLARIVWDRNPLTAAGATSNAALRALTDQVEMLGSRFYPPGPNGEIYAR